MDRPKLFSDRFTQTDGDRLDETPHATHSDRHFSEPELTSIERIDDDRGQAQADGDRGGNSEQRDPHGSPSSLARIARGKSGGSNAQAAAGFLGSRNNPNNSAAEKFRHAALVITALRQ